jgi:hypothetical protein
MGLLRQEHPGLKMALICPWRHFPPKNIFLTPILFILRSKMNKIGVKKIVFCRRRQQNTIYKTPQISRRFDEK